LFLKFNKNRHLLKINNKLAIQTASSTVISSCQICESNDLSSVLFLGYLPPVNQMWAVGNRPKEQPSYPAELLYCNKCSLVQLGLCVDPEVLFPPSYPYTSGTTKILHDNFKELRDECVSLLGMGEKSLIIDIGSNDGTLLSKFQTGNHQVHGVEPTDAADIAIKAGIPTTKAFFSVKVAKKLRKNLGPANIVTAANCFAHIEDVHEIVDAVFELLDEGGVFVSESHYLMDLLETVQYDTIYHEHLRYYSLTSLQQLFSSHGLDIIHASRIPTHGGSIRVYATKKPAKFVEPSVNEVLNFEKSRGSMQKQLENFKSRVIQSKVELHTIFQKIKKKNQRIYGISAPSRASTLVNYAGIDDGIIDYVVEVSSSKKIGHYLPGTIIPVVNESFLFENQPEYALVLAWHIADELVPKLKELGYHGRFIIPLPRPHII